MPTTDSSSPTGLYDPALARKPADRRPRGLPSRGRACTDPVVGAILAGWRFDISGLSPEMSVDYESHLTECTECRRRQSRARWFDVLMISISSLSIVAFLLMAIVIHRIDLLERIDLFHLQVRNAAIDISLQAVAIAGLIVSIVLWVLVAVTTPLPSLFTGVIQERLPSELLERFARRHA